MPIDFKLDKYLDIDLNTGDLSFVEDIDEVAQLMAVETLKNFDEDLYNQETGIKWFGRPSMYDYQRDENYRRLQIRSAYMEIPEITDIPVLSLSKDIDGHVSINFVANSVYGEIVAGNQ